MTEDKIELVARIIEPSAWIAYDLSLAPYKENRGAYASLGEAFWYDLTWRRGCRTPEAVPQFWLEQPLVAPPLAVHEWAVSKVKAAKIIAALDLK